MWGVFVTCYISSGDEEEHQEDPQEHGVNGGPAALSPPPAGTAATPRAPQHQPSFPVWPGCTLRCSHNLSPPLSAARGTLPSKTVTAMLEQEVELFDDFSLRKLLLWSSVMLKRCWNPSFQEGTVRPVLQGVVMFGALQGCSCQGGMEFPRDAVLFIYQEYIHMYTGSIMTGDATPVSKFLVARSDPSGSCVLRNLHLSSLLGAEIFLSWSAMLLLAVFPAPGNTGIFGQFFVHSNFSASACYLECRANSAGNSDLECLHILKNIPIYDECDCNPVNI